MRELVAAVFYMSGGLRPCMPKMVQCMHTGCKEHVHIQCKVVNTRHIARREVGLPHFGISEPLDPMVDGTAVVVRALGTVCCWPSQLHCAGL